jgi:hypothetical protein
MRRVGTRMLGQILNRLNVADTNPVAYLDVLPADPRTFVVFCYVCRIFLRELREGFDTSPLRCGGATNSEPTKHLSIAQRLTP